MLYLSENQQRKARWSGFRKQMVHFWYMTWHGWYSACNLWMMTPPQEIGTKKCKNCVRELEKSRSYKDQRIFCVGVDGKEEG